MVPTGNSEKSCQGGLHTERIFSHWVCVILDMGYTCTCYSAPSEKQIACNSKGLDLVYVKSYN